MRQRNYGGPKLPRELLDQVGASGASNSNGRARGSVKGRKERRRAERDQKKVQRRQPRNFQRPGAVDESESEDNEEDFESPPPKAPAPRNSKAEEKSVKSILKKSDQPAAPATKKPAKEEARKKAKEPEKEKKKRSPSPSPEPKVPKKVQKQLEEEDAEIAALEKKLGIKSKKKLPKAFEDDGLADLLDGLDDELEFAVTGKRKRPEDQEWLESKRRKATGGLIAEESFSEDEESEGSDAEEDDIEDGLDEDEDDEEDEGEGDDFFGFSGEDDADALDDEESGVSEEDSGEEYSGQEKELPKVRENPYKPPVPADSAPAAKYIPPSLRAPAPSDAEAMTRLRRQTQGLLNRLSEANLLTILKDVEKLYQTNPRQYVTSTLIDLLLGLISDRTSLQDTFLILHAGFIAAVYKVIGMDFGAQLVERFALEFDKRYNDYSEESNGKETTNLVSLMAELYNFQVIGCNLVFDYIRIFLEELREINTELLLRIVRMSGPQLRQDDPTALKDIVILLQKSVAEAGEANLSVRTKFMIETINNLKNNRMKTGVAASAITSEHTTRMKKTLGTLNSRSIKASEPLRIGLKDLRDTEKKGKWWLVGASWRNETAEEPGASEKPAKAKKREEAAEEIIESGTADLYQLAKEQRMNTDIRRAIFITIMSASDFKDAHLRLMKLRLKKAQELEIPRVLIHCAGAEQSYNPYYTLIARRLCSEKQLKKAFQFSLWDLFRRMGERDEGDDVDEDEDGEEALTTRKIVNLAKMFGNLIADGGLSIAALKTLNFAYLQPKTEAFVEVLLSTVVLQAQKKSGEKRDEKALLDVVMQAKEAPQMARGLQYFFKKVVSKAEAAGNKADRATVRWGAGVAGDGLTVLATQRTAAE